MNDAITAGTRPGCEQQKHRHQVDERRHRLHGVEHRPRAPARTGRCAPPAIPSGIAIDDRDHHRDQHLAQRVHREVPHARATRSPAMQAKQTTASRTPETRHATAPTPPATIHQGTPDEQVLRADRACRSAGQSLIALVTPARLACDQSTIAFAGAATRRRPGPPATPAGAGPRGRSSPRSDRRRRPRRSTTCRRVNVARRPSIARRRRVGRACSTPWSPGRARSPSPRSRCRRSAPRRRRAAAARRAPRVPGRRRRRTPRSRPCRGPS